MCKSEPQADQNRNSTTHRIINVTQQVAKKTRTHVSECTSRPSALPYPPSGSRQLAECSICSAITANQNVWKFCVRSTTVQRWKILVFEKIHSATSVGHSTASASTATPLLSLSTSSASACRFVPSSSTAAWCGVLFLFFYELPVKSRINSRS